MGIRAHPFDLEVHKGKKGGNKRFFFFCFFFCFLFFFFVFCFFFLLLFFFLFIFSFFSISYFLCPFPVFFLILILLFFFLQKDGGRGSHAPSGGNSVNYYDNLVFFVCLFVFFKTFSHFFFLIL